MFSIKKQYVYTWDYEFPTDIYVGENMKFILNPEKTALNSPLECVSSHSQTVNIWSFHNRHTLILHHYEF